jgi:hypothetical protein
MVYGFELDSPSHWYVTDNWMVTRNCGKSYSCLKTAEEYSKMFDIPFDPKVHVITSLKQLLKLIVEGDATKKIRFGSVLVFDEPQVEGNARNWQSDINQALSQLISTFRNQRLVILFATPMLEMIDKQSRILFHGEFKVEGFDKNTKITTIRPRFLEWNKKKQDFYRKRLIIQYATPNKQVMEIKKLSVWHLSIASKEIIDAYEETKKKFTDDLNRRLLNQIELAEKQQEGKNKSEELFRVGELFDKYGENYIKILQAMPHLSPFTVEKYVLFIKKSKGMMKNKKNNAHGT